ncbi:MAG: peptidylprolyl isomerase [Planctomycetota bacterium]
MVCPCIPAVVAVLLASLPAAAQGKPEKAHAGSTKRAPSTKEKDVTKPHKDDSTTAKDRAIVALDKFAKGKVSQKRADWRTTLPEPPKQTFDAGCDYLWHLQTNLGEITVRLRADVAPMHVTSVIYLTRLGFYDGLTFHRAIKGFMAQGGCPLGTGTGNPGYRLDGEFDDGVKHDKQGILSTANEGRPKTDGSQFFITYVPTPHLDGKHTIFGEVTAGLETVKAFEERSGTMPEQKPIEPLLIERAWVVVVKKTESDKDATPKGRDGAPASGGSPKR